MPTPHSPKRTSAALSSLVLFAALVGCQTAPTGQQAAMPAAPALQPAAPGIVSDSGAELSRHFTIDVDPVHASAFERADRSLQALIWPPMLIDVNFPSVTHDLASGQTTVTMQITNAGSNLTYLKCQVTGSVPVVTPLYAFTTSCSAAGASQTVQLVFKNPSAGAFTITSNFTGIQASDHSTQTGTGTGNATPGGTAATPTPVPAATPTPVPAATPTPVPAPTATPVPAATPTPVPPASTGGFVATASSSMGSLTPDRAIDPDLGSQWANDGYQVPEAWLAVDTGSVHALNDITAKISAQNGGGSYVVEVSNDGVSYTAASGSLRNSSYSPETKTLNAGTQGRFVRLHFFNSTQSPEVRFTVFDLKINGQGNPATPAPVATPTPGPVVAPPANSTGTYFNDFSQYPDNTDPTDFIDPRNEGYSYPWMPAVNWHTTVHNGRMSYMHDGLNNTAYLSFRRYKGTAFGQPNGGLPARYTASLQVTPIQSYTYNPTGDQGTQFYYIDPTHYVELLVKPTTFEVWTCDGGEPFTSTGWNRVDFENTTTAAEQMRTFRADVDANAHTLTPFVDGEQRATLTLPMVTHAHPHYFSMRGTGNIVVFNNLSIKSN